MEFLNILFPNQGEIDPDEYDVYLGDYPIAEAGSDVYKGKDRNGIPVAFKIYKRIVEGQIGLLELRRYQRVTRKAKNYLDGKKVFLKRGNGGQDEFSWEVNPINRVGQLKSREACLVSRFIDGPTLKEEIEQAKYEQPFIEEVLRLISNKLNEDIGTKGISIVPVNVKLSGRKLIVTDLYAQVQRLKEEKG